MQSVKIYIDRPEDRDTTVTILSRNGYTVRQGKEKAAQGNKWIHFVEYWR